MIAAGMPSQWTVKPAWQTRCGAAFLAFLLVAFSASVFFAFSNALLILPAVFTGFLLFLGIPSLFQGGCVVDARSSTLHRWWGLGMTFRSVDIPFSSIERVSLGFGLWPSSVRAARERHVTYHLAISVNGAVIVVRQGLRNHQLALDMGTELAERFNAAFSDGTR